MAEASTSRPPVPTLGILNSPGGTLGVLASLFTPRRAARRVEAAVALQRSVRGRLARQRRRRLLRAAQRIQRAWRRAYELAQKRLRAILQIQRLCKGHLERRRVLSEFQWTTEVAETSVKNKSTQLIRECTGMFEKRGRRWTLFGRYEFLLWQGVDAHAHF